MSSHSSFQPLTGPEGQPTPVSRHGDTVLRPAGPWTPAVHALLDHLEAVGFPGSPRVVGNGHDGHGRETLTYIDGDFVHPHAWSDEGIWHVGRLLRDLHEATATFRPPPGAQWHPWPFHSDAPDAVISHRDTGPWNIVARDGLPVAFIDWPTAGPTDRLDEIAATGWLNAQLHDDDVAERQNLPDAAARAAQLRHFLDGYGLAVPDRRPLVTRMIEYAIRDCAAEAVTARITPDSTDAAPLWALAWRARSAAWMLRHRPLLESAITT
ncbi:aminoglycoside phosphotransferase family protein [Actinomadura sp. WAC 06369]|uniref:aminoglycoside phosphotransferase family protein n=1 Tax=Actinomadura sp. WAC 06369 TaxID=2203193 RepID=UPI000F769E56|nr:aminoglycoside phosphotransferase family protein [Actinomadura sp. WAC 06369]RSN53251.1 trifolitoxin immunity protein [Actinomadura sp. WAC 06369]